MMDWGLEESPFFASKFRRYLKKHPNEVAAAMDNLDTYMHALRMGVKPAMIRAGFIHPEKMGGVVAIDQKGAPGKPKQTRLYIIAVEKEATLFLITIGDKNSQSQDIKDCREFVKSLRG